MDDCPLADAIRHNRMTPSGRTGEELMWLIFDDMAERGREKLPGHCRRGHEMTPENTYRRPDGEASCRTCNRATQRAWQRRNRN